MMKNINYLLILLLGLFLSACTKEEAPTPEDHFINYDIEEVPVTEDYVVGAFYRSFAWDGDISEAPQAGNYESELGDATAYQQHVTWGKTAGIDYFLFTLRSSADSTQHSNDVTFINALLEASNASEMGFALTYNFGNMGLSNNNRIESAGLVSTLIDDFKLMVPFFQKSNYMKLDGKHIIYIQDAADLHSDDNAALYSQLRAEMASQGIELYIIGGQNSWTPPGRYDFRFKDAVDAVTHETYIRINVSWYDRYVMFHNVVDQAFAYHSQFFMDNLGLEYVPQISPSFDGKITNPGSTDIIVEKDLDWFRTLCNVAKRNTSQSRLVFIDSFNDWNMDTQIEPAQNYGEDYLNLIRQQFKVN